MGTSDNSNNLNVRERGQVPLPDAGRRYPSARANRNLVMRDLKITFIACLIILLAALVTGISAGQIGFWVMSALLVSFFVSAFVAAVSTLAHRWQVRSRSQKLAAIILLASIIILAAALSVVFIALSSVDSGSEAYDAIGIIGMMILYAGIIITVVFFLALLIAAAVDARKQRGMTE